MQNPQQFLPMSVQCNDELKHSLLTKLLFDKFWMRHSSTASLPTSTCKTLEEFINEISCDDGDVTEWEAPEQFCCKI